MKLKLAAVITATGLIFGGCTAYKLDDVQNNVRTQFAARNFSKSAELIEQAKEKKIYQDKDMVLYQLERATSYHFGGQFDKSIQAFGSAEVAIDENFTKKVSTAAKSLLLNDNALAYDGEPYEDIYLNAFKSLNFLHKGDIDGALVEARRMSYKMENLEIKYKGMAEAFDKNKDEKNKGRKIEQGKLNIQASPLSHFLAATYFAKTEKEDNARIEFDRLTKAINEQVTLYALPKPDISALETIKDPTSYNVLLVTFAGRAPQKIQEDIRVYDELADFYVKFSIPKLVKIPSQVSGVRVLADGVAPVSLHQIEKMDEVVEELFKIKRPIIYTRTVIRAVAKQIANTAISKQVGKENELAGDLFKFAGQIAGEASEKADLRGWQTLPATAYVNVLKLPAGTHLVKVEFVNSAGGLVSSQEVSITVNGNADELKLVESLYWN